MLAIVVLINGCSDLFTARRFQKEPVGKTVAIASGYEYTKTSKWGLSTKYFADVSFRALDLGLPAKKYKEWVKENPECAKADKAAEQNDTCLSIISVDKEVVSEAEINTLRKGGQIPIVYLKKNPEIFAHEGNRRDKAPWGTILGGLGLFLLAFIFLGRQFNDD